MTNAYQPRVPDAVWESHKPIIEHLYMMENKPLTAPGGVRDIMAHEHNFHATKSQYEWRVTKIWKCCKYNKGGSSSRPEMIPQNPRRPISTSVIQLARRLDQHHANRGVPQPMRSQGQLSRIGVIGSHPGNSTISHFMTQVSTQIAPSALQAGIGTPTLGLFAPLPLQKQPVSLISNGGDLSNNTSPHFNFFQPHSLPLREPIGANFNPPGVASNLSPMSQQNLEPDVLSEYPDINDFFNFELFDPQGVEFVTRDFTRADPPTKTTFYPSSNFPDLTTSIMAISDQLQSVLGTFTQSICILPGNLNILSAPNQHHPESMRIIRSQNIDVQVYHFILHRLINDPASIRGLQDPKNAMDELFKAGLDFLLGPQVQHLDKVINSVPYHFTKALEQALFRAAIELGAAGGLAALLARGVDPNEPHNFGHERLFPLERTCFKRHVQATEVLLDHGVNPNEYHHKHILSDLCIHHEWHPPLCISTNMDILRLLVGRGAVLQAEDASYVITHCTSIERQFLVENLLNSICEMILDQPRLLGIILDPGHDNDLSLTMMAGLKKSCFQRDREQHDVSWFHILRNAAEFGRHDVVASLIEEGTVPDLESFVNAARSKNMDTFLLLLDYGLDPNGYIGDHGEGTTAFASCIDGGFLQALEVLLNQGCHARAVEHKLSFQAALIASCESGDIGLLRLLLQDASPQWLEDCGAMAITAAIEAAKPAVIEELLHCSGIKPDEKSLFAAVRSRNPTLSALLSQRMTLIPSGDLYSTILTETILHGYDQLAMNMLQYVEPYFGVATIDCTLDREENVTRLLRSIAAQPEDKTHPFQKIVCTPLSAAILAAKRNITQLLLPAIVKAQWREYKMITVIEKLDNSVFLTPLAACAYSNDIEQLQALLIRGADSEDEIAVFAATNSGNRKLLDVLLHGYSLQHPNRSMAVGTKALLWSIQAGALDMLSALVKVVDPHERCVIFRGWECPLQAAVLHHCDHGGTSQALRIMLPYVSDVNHVIRESQWSSETPLIYAINRKSLQTVHLLVEVGGAHVSLLPRWGCNRTPLQAAAGVGSLEIVHYLLVKGAQVDEAPAAHAGATALQLACLCGFIEIALILLDKGADVNASPAMFHGRTAFEGATEHGCIDMMTLLLENGADLLADDQKQFRRAIKFAQENAQYAAIEHAERLLELAQRRSKDNEMTL